ncbi:MAG: hypothetical protein ACYCT1_15125 [Steroidobacteraceae bacterium]
MPFALMMAEHGVFLTPGQPSIRRVRRRSLERVSRQVDVHLLDRPNWRCGFVAAKSARVGFDGEIAQHP